jgi:hypothetical protein
MRRYIYWRLKMREPFGLLIGSVPNIHAKHPRAFNKTIMVENNDVDSAFQLLNRYAFFQMSEIGICPISPVEGKKVLQDEPKKLFFYFCVFWRKFFLIIA